MKQNTVLVIARHIIDFCANADYEDNVLEYHLPESSMRYIILCLAYDDDMEDRFIRDFSYMYFCLLYYD